MKRGVRQQEGEDFSPTKIEEIIQLLEAEKPATKKDACARLGMAYNTARLNKIIEEYKENKAYHEKRRKELRSQPLSTEDKAFIVSSYLEEANLSLISDTTFRSVPVIKRVLEQFNIPLRSSSTNYQNPIYLENVSNEYAKDDLVYSARYDEPAYISKKLTEDVYRMWLLKTEQYSMQPYWELGDLRKIQKDLGISIQSKKYWEEGGAPGELQQAIAIAMQNAKKRKKNE
jgi:hypothetical protein